MKLKILAPIIILLLVFIFGRIQKDVLDDVRLTKVIGYDEANNKLTEATGLAAIHNVDKSISNKVLTSKDTLSKENREKKNEQSDLRVASGTMEVVLYSNKVASKGILKLVDTLHRDPNISSRLLLAVVDGETKKILDNQYSNKDTGSFLSYLLEHNIKTGLLPKTNLHLFLSAYYTKGKTPYLPLIKVENDGVLIKGIALFKGDQYVKTIKRDEMFLFKALLEKIKLGSLKVKLNEKDDVSVQSIITEKKILVRNEKTKPEIFIQLKIKGIVREFEGKVLGKSVAKQTEQATNKQLEHQANRLIKDFQKLNIDPWGFGNEVKVRTRKWDSQKWKKDYPDIKISVKVHSDITSSGIVKE
ncbi:Ger(x)C family spore germination protein [Bacillus clarus]|uniref:Ger(X)C family spore germination protein n=1 Tax=Bacillus clarus TaxID=2338372 RepID=A0A090YNN8_9BACI|nr:Ger(x)C family spore germination protein [Bacillus clarus]KFM99871.1 germination, Ger(x)C family protein [Bacillus clarus]RFT65607.1 Ger(x)C family spore germination protein [Bacillus clarus]